MRAITVVTPRYILYPATVGYTGERKLTAVSAREKNPAEGTPLYLRCLMLNMMIRVNFLPKLSPVTKTYERHLAEILVG